MITVKRVYEAPAKSDGFRILADRLWPRGLSKDKAKVDLWLKDVAASDDLRKWFGHNPQKWLEFKDRYFKELETKGELIVSIAQKSAGGNVTLLYGAKDQKFNNAVALKEYLDKMNGFAFFGLKNL